MYVLLTIVLFVTSIRAQYSNQCECSCCIGQSCLPVIVGTVNVQNCSAEICLAQCRCTYSQCGANPPYGQLLSRCLNPIISYTCQCACCNVGFPTCTVAPVGTAIAYACDPSSCGIACKEKYPLQCSSGLNGQVQGICAGPVLTTTAMTTIAPWSGNVCSCFFCQSGYMCQSNVLLGITSASQCSSSDCTSACQSRYTSTSICSTLYLNQISGVCLSEGNARIKCKCKCCGSYDCIDYEINTNETCGACNTRCRQVAPCASTNRVDYTCTADQPKITVNFFLFVFIVMNECLFGWIVKK